jgi:predicted DNA-binding transcriptional regulator AlpA
MVKYNQIQYVIGKDDLREILNEIIDERIALFEKRNEEKRNEELVTYDRVMELLGVSKATIWRWKKRGYLVPIRIGGNDRYRMSDIKKIMEG